MAQASMKCLRTDKFPWAKSMWFWRTMPTTWEKDDGHHGSASCGLCASQRQCSRWWTFLTACGQWCRSVWSVMPKHVGDRSSDILNILHSHIGARGVSSSRWTCNQKGYSRTSKQGGIARITRLRVWLSRQKRAVSAYSVDHEVPTPLKANHWALLEKTMTCLSSFYCWCFSRCHCSLWKPRLTQELKQCKRPC